MKLLNISLNILFAGVLLLGMLALIILAGQSRPQMEWKVYQNKSDGFYLRYPSIFSIQDKPRIEFGQETKSIHLSHSVPYKHQNPCDFKGDPLDSESSLKDIVDFDILLEIKDPKTVPIKDGDSRLVSIGSLNGYTVWMGVEGCGYLDYYFPLSSDKMLVVRRSLITELSGSITNSEEYLKVPGIIQPKDEDKFFRAIISSFKLAK